MDGIGPGTTQLRDSLYVSQTLRCYGCFSLSWTPEKNLNLKYALYPGGGKHTTAFDLPQGSAAYA